jgi:adenosylhomocysteinase
MLMAGKRVAVVGYGWVGRGIATYVRAMGGTPLVVEVDPVKALEAYMDGAVVATAEDAYPQADFIITCTGGMRAVTGRHIPLLKSGAILANAGHHDLEVDVKSFALAAEELSIVRAGIERFHFADKHIDVLANGALVNIAGGLGHPIEIMDLSFAVQGIGCHELARGGYEPGVHVISPELDAEIAAAKLAHHGINLDDLADDQLDQVEALDTPTEDEPKT